MVQLLRILHLNIFYQKGSPFISEIASISLLLQWITTVCASRRISSISMEHIYNIHIWLAIPTLINWCHLKLVLLTCLQGVRQSCDSSGYVRPCSARLPRYTSRPCAPQQTKPITMSYLKRLGQPRRMSANENGENKKVACITFILDVLKC